ncbi:DNA primase [Oryzomonas sagensis]|uniref:DNA primase n=1 Tax=Oryzomonas sagensis TaxID=2603857 RepID=A0ABQ6TPA4_9BACT|nr:DNA primase [Oryzomonas sagensis]KAB0670157.1 DNA primase [Oryzomonas sagensis]
MIPEEKVREIAERVSILEVVSDYVQLRRAGANYVGLCPFHGEKTPSFNVNPAREVFHCFGCGEGGNAFSFIMKMEGVGFPEAVKLLARKAGVEIEERQLTPAERHAQDERQQFQRINELAEEYFRTVLLKEPAGQVARNYLKDRAVDEALAADYRLGFAPDRWDGLAKHLKTRGADLETAQKLGILRKGDKGWHDLFRNRLIFPIRDHKGRVIAFAGRVLDTSLPKYINSPESPLYHKSAVMFGLDMALPAIRTENSVIIVEGYFDHLALYRAGIRNVVATCGTALTTIHAGLIKRHAARVYTLFDSDAAGLKATFRSMELFLDQRMPAYVITLPSGDDPDSFLAKNPVEAFTACRDKARPIFDHFVRSLLVRIPPDSVDNKVRVIDEVIPRFKKIADPVERDLYEKEICRLLGITVHAFRKRQGGMQVTARDMPAGGHPPAHRGDRSQDTLLALLIRYPEARGEIRAFGVDNLFEGPHRQVAEAVLALPDNGDDPGDVQSLLDRLEDPDQRRILSQVLVNDDHLADIDWRTVLANYKRNKEKRALHSIRDIAAQLAVLDPDSDAYRALLQQADALRTRKSKL